MEVNLSHYARMVVLAGISIAIFAFGNQCYLISAPHWRLTQPFYFWTSTPLKVSGPYSLFLSSTQIAREHGIRFFETSAKANINIEKAFLTLAEDILRKVRILLEDIGSRHCSLLIPVTRM